MLLCRLTMSLVCFQRLIQCHVPVLQVCVAGSALWHSVLMLPHHGLLVWLLTATFVDGLGAISSYANAGLRSTLSRFESYAVNFSWNLGSLWICQICLL